MATVPIRESGDPFGHEEANQPFAIEAAIVDGSGNLDITIGPGRIRWGGDQYELANNTIVTQTGAAGSTTYYAIIDFNGGAPGLGIVTDGPASASSEPDWTYLGSVTTDTTPTVTNITDLRGLLPPSAPRVSGGSAVAPAYSFFADPDTGLYASGVDELAVSLAGTMHTRFTRESGEARLYLGGDGNDWIGYEPTEEWGRLVSNDVERLRWDSGGVTVTGELEVTGTVRDYGSLVLDGNGGDLVLRTFDVDRARYDTSLDRWLFYTGSGTIALEIDNLDTTITGVLTLGNDLDFNGSGGVIGLDQGSRVNPAIRWSEDFGDTGFFADNSLNRLAATVDLGSSSDYYSSTITTQDAFTPGRDGTQNLGNGTFRWEDVWAVDNTINTSDVRTKDAIADSDLGLDFIRALRPIRFQRKGRARPHYGFAAQDVKQAMDAIGAEDFAGYIDPSIDPPDPKRWPEAYDEDGNLTAPLGLRTGEFIGPLTKAVQELAERLDAAGIA